jgi:hypothetical protein
MLVMLAIVTAGMFGLACSGPAPDFGLSVACTRASAIELVKAFIAALVANQATYLITPSKSAAG